MSTEEPARLPAPRRPEQSMHPIGAGELPRRKPWGRDTTELYDRLSEVLRTRPRHAGEAYHLVREADRLLSVLDERLRAGARLPEPWRGARS